MQPVLKRPQHQHCHRSADQCCGPAQHQSFDQELLNDAPTARTQRAAYCDLTLPRRRPSQQQAGYIHACDQPQHCGCASQREQRLPHVVIHQCVFIPRNVDGSDMRANVSVGILCCHAALNFIHLANRVRQTRARRKPCNHLVVRCFVLRAYFVRVTWNHRHPDHRILQAVREYEVSRHHANDGKGFTAQLDCAAEDLRICSECISPDRVTQQDRVGFLWSSGAIRSFEEGASHLCMDTKRSEEVRAYRRIRNSNRSIFSFKKPEMALACFDRVVRDVLEPVTARPPFDDVEKSCAPSWLAIFCNFIDLDQ